MNFRHAHRRTGGSFAIDDQEYAFLVDYSRKIGARNVLEFGPGDSTLAFLENNLRVWTFENSPEHLVAARQRFAADPAVAVVGYDLKTLNGPREWWACPVQLAFVDGPFDPSPEGNARFLALRFAEVYATHIILHDAKREKERRCMEHMKARGWTCTLVDTARGMWLFE